MARGRPRVIKPLVQADEVFIEPESREENALPLGWRKGALLNVRNYGPEYIITLWPEEYSDEREERAIKFTNLGECQDFVSKWYAAEHHDPRAR